MEGGDMSVKKTLILLLFIGIFVLGVATGCGSNSPTSNLGQVAAEGDTNARNVTVDACQIVTLADASTIFGEQAVEDRGTPIADPNLLGECLWTWDTETENQLIQFRIWNGEQYYGEPAADSQPLNIGDKGNIRINEIAGVDIEWVQDGKTVSLSYSNIGPGLPDPSTKANDITTLARKAAAELAESTP
jgi:hypothetical protein